MLQCMLADLQYNAQCKGSNLGLQASLPRIMTLHAFKSEPCTTTSHPKPAWWPNAGLKFADHTYQVRTCVHDATRLTERFSRGYFMVLKFIPRELATTRRSKCRPLPKPRARGSSRSLRLQPAPHSRRTKCRWGEWRPHRDLGPTELERHSPG